MDITVSYVIYRAIIGLVICVAFGFVQNRYRHFNLIYILLGLFVLSSLICLILSDEILYILITIYFIFSTAIVSLVRFIHFIKNYRNNQSNRNRPL
jgi:uncharacterized membrane protein